MKKSEWQSRFDGSLVQFGMRLQHFVIFHGSTVKNIIIYSFAVVGVMTFISFAAIFSDTVFTLIDGELFQFFVLYWLTAGPIYLYLAWVLSVVVLFVIAVEWMANNRSEIWFLESVVDTKDTENKELQTKLDAWWAYANDEGLDLLEVDFDET